MIHSHPVEILIEELKARNISNEQFAKDMNMSLKEINKILSEHVDITPEFASKLDEVLNIPSRIWLNLQKNYENDLQHQ